MILWHKSQIFLIFSVPCFFNCIHCQFSIKIFFFNFVTDDDMQGIGKLICFQTDQSRFYFIECRKECIQRNLFVFWHFLLQIWVQVLPEFSGSSYMILVESGLGFVHCTFNSAPESAFCDLIVRIIIIKPVSGLMNHCQNRMDQLITVCGGSGITRSGADTYRMMDLK